MNERLLILEKSILRDLEAIAGIYAHLAAHPLLPESDNDTVIIVAYYLHNLYNAFENIFRAIAAAFENSIDDLSQWHAQLLDRMRLDVLPLRPAVIDDAAYDALDELRRFRHVFRHTYGVTLDPCRYNRITAARMNPTRFRLGHRAHPCLIECRTARRRNADLIFYFLLSTFAFSHQYTGVHRSA